MKDAVHFAIALLTSIGLSAAPLQAADPGSRTYCGVRCVYAAGQALGRNISMESLLTPSYVGSARGSSLQELCLAANDNGLFAETVTGMSVDGLRGLQCPMILHVRSDGYHANYTHWVLLLNVGFEDATILDPSFGTETITLGDLSARWDGSGLLVSERRSGLYWSRFSCSLVSFASVAVIATLCLLLATLVRNLSPARLSRYTAYKVAPLGSAAALLSLVWHSVAPHGFLRNSQALASVRANRVLPSLPVIGFAELQALRNSSGLVIADARPAAAYTAAHIPGAVNLPINSGKPDLDRVIEGFPPGAKIVLYCQSERCTWADVIAGDLAARGFPEIFIYRGGWNDWSKNV